MRELERLEQLLKELRPLVQTKYDNALSVVGEYESMVEDGAIDEDNDDFNRADETLCMINGALNIIDDCLGEVADWQKDAAESAEWWAEYEELQRRPGHVCGLQGYQRGQQPDTVCEACAIEANDKPTTSAIGPMWGSKQ